jgi:hypothetical protein
MSILCSQKEINGATLVRLISRAEDREEQRAKHLQLVPKPDPKPKTTIGNKLAGWFLAAVGLYIVVHIIVALVRR